jgi:hypothetical protein
LPRQGAALVIYLLSLAATVAHLVPLCLQSNALARRSQYNNPVIEQILQIFQKLNRRRKAIKKPSRALDGF